MSKKKDKGINPDLDKFISDLMKQVMNDPDASVTDKVKVLDRALKLEALKMKDADDAWGAGFMDVDDDEDK
jgi:hypothetical protein